VNRTGRVKKGFPWLRIAVHLIGWLPLVQLIYEFATNHLTANPIQATEQRIGLIAMYFLIATLAVTPTYIVTGWREILPRRRALGMYTFLYASLHFLTFAGLDYGFDFGQIFDLITTKPFIIVGSLAFLLLVPLAVTSFDFFVRRMKRNWKRLHWLVYPTGLIVILHFAWSLKGDLFALRGNISKPLFFGILVIILLVLRLPPVRRNVSALRQKIRGRFITRPSAPH
jgi:methionine sulfoxide reductase heme-binding subunit